VSGWGVPARAYRNGDGTVAGFQEAWRDGSANAADTYQWGHDLGDLDGDHKLDALAGGHAFDGMLTLSVFTNVSTGGQNITFAPQPRVVSSSIAQNTHDVELAPLPVVQ